MPEAAHSIVKPFLWLVVQLLWVLAMAVLHAMAPSWSVVW
jgi:hypothetical protein